MTVYLVLRSTDYDGITIEDIFNSEEAAIACAEEERAKLSLRETHSVIFEVVPWNVQQRNTEKE